MLSIFRGRIAKPRRSVVASSSVVNEHVSRILRIQTTIASNWKDRFGFSFQPRFHLVNSTSTRWYNVTQIELGKLLQLKTQFSYLAQVHVNFDASCFETTTDVESSRGDSESAIDAWEYSPDAKVEDETSIAHLTNLKASSVRNLATILSLLRHLRARDESISELTYSFLGGGRDMIVTGTTRWSYSHLRVLNTIRDIADVHFDLAEKTTRFSLVIF